MIASFGLQAKKYRSSTDKAIRLAEVGTLIGDACAAQQQFAEAEEEYVAAHTVFKAELPATASQLQQLQQHMRALIAVRQKIDALG